MPEKIEKTALLIGLPSRVATLLRRLYASSGDEVKEISELIRTDRAGELALKAASDERTGQLLLAASLYAIEEEHENYRRLGIDDAVFYATAGDITAWAGNYTEDTGYTGLDNAGWIANHIRGELFTLGRLQFQFSRLPFLKDGTSYPAGLTAGDNVLNIHIPQGQDYYRGKLPLSFSPEETAASFRNAETFFPRYFPDFDFKGYMCGSWLLAPALKEVLPPSSNILAFQSLFDIVSVNVTSRQSEERVFGRNYSSKTLGQYPRTTSLQKNLYTYLRAGHTVGEGRGVRLRQDKR